MPDTISATGVVGTPPTFSIVGNGLARLTFRLGSTQRKFNREASGWENGETNWYTVVAFRRLAENSSHSLSKGDRVVVTGRLRVNEWEREGRRGTAVELIADGIGHDLTFGTTTYSKSASPAAPQVTAPGDVETAEPPMTAAAVDSGGWALPGGTGDAGESDEGRSHEDTQEHSDEADDQVGQLEFAGAEPPF